MLAFYKGKRVLVTGHTGFKGSWLCKILLQAGATVYGYALKPETEPALYDMAELSGQIVDCRGDIRDRETLMTFVKKVNPELIFHLAAQPLVRESYVRPVDTYETNVMGTVNILESARHADAIKSIVNVTTDKVYRNEETGISFRETDYLDGWDPYSNSKSCSELISGSYARSFFKENGIAVSTCRAGNVIGGGDYAANRIIPDCVRAAKKKEQIIIRQPQSIRPYQHVLEPLMVYLLVAKQQYESMEFAGAYNIGPKESDCITTEQLTQLFCEQWGEGQEFRVESDYSVHEAQLLRLNCEKLEKVFGWKPVWDVQKTVQKIVAWEKAVLQTGRAGLQMEIQISEYEKDRSMCYKGSALK